MGRFIKRDQYHSLKDRITGGFKLPDGTTDQRTVIPFAGETRYNTSLNRLEYYNGTAYVQIAKEGTVNIIKDSFTGDGSTLSYVLSTVPASENNILVFIGNVFQEATAKYTLTGSTITFASAPPLSQAVVVLQGFDSTVVS